MSQLPSHHAALGLVAVMLLAGCGGHSSDAAARPPASSTIAGAGDQNNFVGVGGQSPMGGAGNLGGNAGNATEYRGIAGTMITDNPCGAVDSSLADADSKDLFAAASIPTFDLYLPADSWSDLQVHARDEVYVPAQACFNGKAVGIVGMRFKGSFGSLFNCFDSTGKNTCRKLGMKVKFDEFVAKQHFYGLDRINFHGYHYDNSYIKEALSYDLYRSMGIVAPRASWALLRVNGEPQGLFGMVEEIDKRFVKNRWPDNDQGSLFKEVWPGQTDATFITTRLHTNTSKPDITAMQAFSVALNAAPLTELRTTLGQYVDLDYFAKYMAVDDAIANFDGLTTFYTSGAAEQAGNHNFFLYQESSNRFTIVPWDLEATLDLASGFGNAPYWQIVPSDCSTQYPAWGGPLNVIAAGCNRVLRGLAADPTQYRAAAQQLLDGPFSLSVMQANIERYASWIRAEATKDPHGPGASEFEKSVGFVKDALPRLRRRLERFVAGSPSVPQVLATTALALTDFEQANDDGLNDGTTQMSNAHTTASVAVETAAPIAGAKSLRIDFKFGNETDPWQQWLLYTIPVDAGSKDCSKFTGIRFKARADSSRGLRINLMSPKNTLSSKGIEVGWDVNTNINAQTFTLKFADAIVPVWATDPRDSLASIVQTVTGIQFMPQCNGRDASDGQLPPGKTDDGSVTIDDIEFY